MTILNSDKKIKWYNILSLMGLNYVVCIHADLETFEIIEQDMQQGEATLECDDLFVIKTFKDEDGASAAQAANMRGILMSGLRNKPRLVFRANGGDTIKVWSEIETKADEFLEFMQSLSAIPEEEDRGTKL